MTRKDDTPEAMDGGREEGFEGFVFHIDGWGQAKDYAWAITFTGKKSHAVHHCLVDIWMVLAEKIEDKIIQEKETTLTTGVILSGDSELPEGSLDVEAVLHGGRPFIGVDRRRLVVARVGGLPFVLKYGVDRVGGLNFVVG